MIETPASNRNASLLDAALTYHGRGWTVFGVAGKRPLRGWKHLQRRRPDRSQLREMVREPGITGLALITGKASGGVGCRDFDCEDAYRRWAEDHARDARRLPTVKTARGYHVYGRLDEEQYIDFGDGELRADSGHFVLLPPSLHPDGVVYQWTVTLGKTLPPLPPSLSQPCRCTSGDTGTQDGSQPSSNTACSTARPQPYAELITQQLVLSAIAATLPTGPGQRNRRLFDLARRLKAIDGLDDLEILEAVVRQWHQQALPFIRTRHFSTSWDDFETAWLNVKTPFGVGIAQAFELARRQPLPPIRGSPYLGILAALCRNLGGDGRTFFLSQYTVAALFKVAPMTGWRWLKTLRFYKVIERVKRGSLTAEPGGLASEYRFIGQRGGIQ
jgi:hypothetical protein